MGCSEKIDMREIVSGKVCYRSDPSKLKPPYALVFFSRRHQIKEDFITKIVAQAINEEGIRIDEMSFSTIGVYVPLSEAEKKEEIIKRTISENFAYSPVIFDQDSEIKDKFEISELPAILITTKNGEIKKKICGFEQIYNLSQKLISGFEISEFRKELKISYHKHEVNDERTEILFESYGRKLDPSKFYFESPGKIAYTRATRLLAIADRGRKQILVLSYGGYWEPFDIIGKEGGGDLDDSEYEIEFEKTSFVRPSGVCFTESGRFLLIGDLFTSKIKIADVLTRKILGFIRIPMPQHIARANGKFYVSSLTGKIFKLNSVEEKIRNLKYFDDITNMIEINELACRLKLPSAVIMTDDGRLVVVDSGDSSINEIVSENRIVKITGGSKEGHVDGNFSVGQMCFPQSVESFRDVLFVADTLNNSIRILIDGRISTIVLRNMELNEPEEIRLGAGILLVSDTANRRVIEIEPVHMEGRNLRISDNT
ncbi:MAG: hypothetical protein N2254_09560 [bacterium]|nr:hypothetical protein [bacterium]